MRTHKQVHEFLDNGEYHMNLHRVVHNQTKNRYVLTIDVAIGPHGQYSIYTCVDVFVNEELDHFYLPEMNDLHELSSFAGRFWYKKLMNLALEFAKKHRLSIITGAVQVHPHWTNIEEDE